MFLSGPETQTFFLRDILTKKLEHPNLEERQNNVWRYILFWRNFLSSQKVLKYWHFVFLVCLFLGNYCTVYIYFPFTREMDFFVQFKTWRIEDFFVAIATRVLLQLISFQVLFDVNNLIKYIYVSINTKMFHILLHLLFQIFDVLCTLFLKSDQNKQNNVDIIYHTYYISIRPLWLIQSLRNYNALCFFLLDLLHQRCNVI